MECAPPEPSRAARDIPSPTSHIITPLSNKTLWFPAPRRDRPRWNHAVVKFAVSRSNTRMSRCHTWRCIDCTFAGYTLLEGILVGFSPFIPVVCIFRVATKAAEYQPLVCPGAFVLPAPHFRTIYWIIKQLPSLIW